MASSKGKRRGYRPPPPPSPEVVEAVEDIENTAERQLNEARAREPRIELQRRKIERIRRENALGPRFWRAVGGI